jgi:multidrug efflux pump subunit AcrB
VLQEPGIRDVFAFAGDGGLNNNTGGAEAPADTIGQVQIDLEPWGARGSGNLILDELRARLADIARHPDRDPCRRQWAGVGQARLPASVGRQLGRIAGRDPDRARPLRRVRG